MLHNLYFALLITSGTQRYATNPYNQPQKNVFTALRSCTIIMRLTEVLYVSQLVVFAGLYAVDIEYPHNTDPLAHAVFSATRVYSVTERNKILSLIVMVLDLVPAGTNMVCTRPSTYMFSHDFCAVCVCS